MRLVCSSLLPCSIGELAPELAKPALLNHVSWPMLVFDAVDPRVFPEVFAAEKYRTRLRIGGRLSIGEHTLDLQMAPGSGPGLVWHDAGYSNLIRVWDHKITLEDSSGMTRYTDEVEIQAGLLTVPAWLFARAYYAHRQRRLRRLVASRY